MAWAIYIRSLTCTRDPVDSSFRSSSAIRSLLASVHRVLPCRSAVSDGLLMQAGLRLRKYLGIVRFDVSSSTRLDDFLVLLALSNLDSGHGRALSM